MHHDIFDAVPGASSRRLFSVMMPFGPGRSPSGFHAADAQ
jgi:hypothetical protein